MNPTFLGACLLPPMPPLTRLIRQSPLRQLGVLRRHLRSVETERIGSAWSFFLRGSAATGATAVWLREGQSLSFLPLRCGCARRWNLEPELGGLVVKWRGAPCQPGGLVVKWTNPLQEPGLPIQIQTSNPNSCGSTLCFRDNNP